MKLLKMMLMTFTLLFLLAACSSEKIVPTELPTDPIISISEPTETQSPETQPRETHAATEPTKSIKPTEPTIPPLGESAGSRFECYYSDEYDDFLNYYVHIPEDAVVNMPLIVYLHGDGEVDRPYALPERGLKNFAVKIYGDAYPFIILEPNTRVKSWIKGCIPELLIGLIDRVAERYSINVDKIILTGHSRGAIGVWNMISTYPEYFSAAVPVSSPHGKGHIDYVKAAGVPVWTFAGTVGETERGYHKYLEQNVDQISVCGGFGKFTVLKGYEHSETRGAAYVEETFEWMLSQVNGVIPEE